MKRQKGLSLVELLIAMALGLVLMLGVVSIFISSKRTYSVVTAQSQAQENGRVVKYFLGRSLRQAGYWDDPKAARNFASEGVFGQDEVVHVTDNDSTDAAVLDGTDTISVRFNGSADGAISDCLGRTPGADEFVINRYYVAPASGTALVPRLMCQSQLLNAAGTVTATQTQPLIVGVEDLQVEVGENLASGKQQYKKASDVTDWASVKSVRVAILTTSNQDTAGEENTRTYNLIGGETATASGDSRVRQVHRDTVYLRNFRG